MRKMTEADVKHIVQLLKKWKRRPLFWSDVQQQISIDLLAGEKAWSRQSLVGNDDINKAWTKAHARFVAPDSADGSRDHDPEESEVERLQAAFDELKSKYDKLLVKHRQLAYNASMLPGGTKLLLDPLPDNTPSQRRSSGSKGSKRS